MMQGWLEDAALDTDTDCTRPSRGQSEIVHAIRQKAPPLSRTARDCLQNFILAASPALFHDGRACIHGAALPLLGSVGVWKSTDGSGDSADKSVTGVCLDAGR